MALWPQFTLLVLMAMDIGLALGKHGEPKGNFNVWITVVTTGLIFFILLKGGFFDHLLGD